MGHPEGRWSIVSSCYFHFQQNLTFKIVYSNCLVLRCHYCTSCSCFSHRYGYPYTRTLFLSICFLRIAHSAYFSCHISFIFSAIMSFISLVSLRNSLLRLIAACNIAEFVFVWCVPTIRISRSSLLSTHSISFVTSCM